MRGGGDREWEEEGAGTGWEEERARTQESGLVREGTGGERGRVSSLWEGSARCERVSAHRGAEEQDCVKEGGEQEAEAALKLPGGGEHERGLRGWGERSHREPGKRGLGL